MPGFWSRIPSTVSPNRAAISASESPGRRRTGSTPAGPGTDRGGRTGRGRGTASAGHDDARVVDLGVQGEDDRQREQVAADDPRHRVEALDDVHEAAGMVRALRQGEQRVVRVERRAAGVGRRRASGAAVGAAVGGGGGGARRSRRCRRRRRRPASGGGAVGSASVGPGLATATGPRDATGISRPPRPATKVIAKTALAATNRADARTAGVSVRRSSCPVGPSNPLLRRFAGPGL